MNNTANLNRLELPILLGAVADLQQLGTTEIPNHRSDYRGLVLHAKIIDAQNGMVRVDASRWLKMSIELPSLRMAVSRAYTSLQRRGLIERHAMGYTDKRTTHLKPTEAGIALAKELTATPATT